MAKPGAGRMVGVPPSKMAKYAQDSFVNFLAGLGINTDNANSASSYAFNFLTKNRILLEAMYAGSWIVGAAVDIPADDMTKGGIEIQSTLDPSKGEELEEALEDLQIWKSINSCIKWSRLYGTCMGFIMIEGQNPKTPLRIDTVSEGQFRGILPMDRWQLVPSLGNLIGVDELGPNIGYPKFYDTVPDAIFPNFGKIHHSRLIRFDCIERPHYQKMTDSMWAQSIIERLNDRLIAFDSTTTGIAQLVYKAYLRTWKIEGLREIVGAGGAPLKGLEAQIQMSRRVQGIEGITLLDSKDEFEAHSYTFSGLDDVLLAFGEQLGGALDIPLVRLFAQAPAGLNSTGESDLRTYYDGIHKKQENTLRRPLNAILDLTARSKMGMELPKGFSFEFAPLWLMSDKDKSEIAVSNTGAIVDAIDKGVVSRATGLKELRQQADRSGMWSNITDSEIEDAENEPPLSEQALQEHEGRENALNAPEETGQEEA